MEGRELIATMLRSFLLSSARDTYALSVFLRQSFLNVSEVAGIPSGPKPPGAFVTTAACRLADRLGPCDSFLSQSDGRLVPADYRLRRLCSIRRCSSELDETYSAQRYCGTM
jgi:hypothetical protein